MVALVPSALKCGMVLVLLSSVQAATPSPMPSFTPSTSAPRPWTSEALWTILKQVIRVELYTIPLYLTGQYSIQQENEPNITLNGTDMMGNPVDDMFKASDVVESVVVQEMFHLLWACNLAIAANLPAPYWEEALRPPLMTSLSGVPQELNLKMLGDFNGVGNLKTVIDALVAIERPAAKQDALELLEPNPLVEYGPQESYDSIGALYLSLYWGLRHFDSSNNTFWNTNMSLQQMPFCSTTGCYGGIPQVHDMETAKQVILAIVEQGEGLGAFIDPNFTTPYDVQQNGVLDTFTHYDRFLAIQKNIDQIPVFNMTLNCTGRAADNQSQLSNRFRDTLDIIRNAFTGGPLLSMDMLNAMYGVIAPVKDLIRIGETPHWSSSC